MQNVSNDRLVALLRVTVSDQDGQQKVVHKPLYAKLPTWHHCTFAEDIFPNTTGNGSGVIGGGSISSQAMVKAKQMTAVSLHGDEEDIIVDDRVVIKAMRLQEKTKVLRRK